MNFSRVHGDVFRAPQGRMLLSVLIGNGVQITIMSLITLGKVLFLKFYWRFLYVYLVFACLGFLSPASRGALMTCKYLIVVLCSFIWYVQVRLSVMSFWVHQLVILQRVYIKVSIDIEPDLNSRSFSCSVWRWKLEKKCSYDCCCLSWVKISF